MVLKAYDSNNLVMLSDHRPVFAQFEYKIALQAYKPVDYKPLNLSIAASKGV